MDQGIWTQEYERFLRQCMEEGQLERWGDSEHREHPRFRLWSNIIWTTGEFQFSIVDLSISGIAFDSNRPFESDREIVVRLSDLISARATVIGCSELDATPMFFTGRHRVRSRFSDTLEGLRFLVMVKDMKQLRIET